MSGLTAQVTAYVVEDDPSVRDSLCWLIESHRMRTRAFESGESFLDNYDEQWQGCIILDVRMPGLNGLEVQDLLGERGCRLPIVVVTGHADVPMAIRAMKAGAFDFIEKPYSDEILIDCVRRALEQGMYEHVEGKRKQEIHDLFMKLTCREREVMQMVVSGKANKVIAAELGVSEKTIEAHRAKVMTKMGAKSLSDLVRTSMAVDAQV